jgi:hypothetical protein
LSGTVYEFEFEVGGVIGGWIEPGYVVERCGDLFWGGESRQEGLERKEEI